MAKLTNSITTSLLHLAKTRPILAIIFSLIGIIFFTIWVATWRAPTFFHFAVFAFLMIFLAIVLLLIALFTKAK
jgi:hypothetical protein